MRPYVICHMLSSVDGKIDGAILQAVTRRGEYEDTASQLRGARGDAWICGRVRPGIDARHGISAVFAGLDPARKAAVALQLKSVEQRENGSLWVRYEVKRES